MPEAVVIPGPVSIGGPVFSKTGLATPSQTLRTRFTLAQLNAGATILAALTGGKYRLVDFTVIAVGGAVTGSTSVRIAGTQGASGVQLVTIAVAALTQGANVKPNSSNVTMLTDGAGTAVCDINTAITLNSNGTSATATHVDVILTYAVELA